MKAIDILQRLEQMDQLIRLKATGPPKQFASRLDISQSMMYNYLDLLRSLGGPIQYNKIAASYEYTHPVVLHLRYTKS